VKHSYHSELLVHSRRKNLIGCIGSKPVHVLTDEEKKKFAENEGLVR